MDETSRIIIDKLDRMLYEIRILHPRCETCTLVNGPGCPMRVGDGYRLTNAACPHYRAKHPGDEFRRSKRATKKA